MKQKTLSVWTVVLDNREAFAHAGYKETRDPLWPSLAPTKVMICGPYVWSVGEMSPLSHSTTVGCGEAGGGYMEGCLTNPASRLVCTIFTYVTV